MTTLIESLSTALLLILAVVLLMHMLNGTTGKWLSSTFKAAQA